MTSNGMVLGSILDGVGWPQVGRDRIAIETQAKALPTPMPIERIAAGVLAAVGTAVTEVHGRRNGIAPQSGHIGTRAAGLAVDASSYLRVDGKDLKDKDRLTGFYRARDGWVFLHGNFPHLRAGLLALFGAVDKESLAMAVAGWAAQDIEEEAARRGLCAVVFRSREHWIKTPQAKAAMRAPLIRITRIGDAPPVPFTPGVRPLEGIKALDLSRVIAGPMTGKTLAEHGADVMLVSGPQLPFIEPLVIETGFGKLSSFLDLTSVDDKMVLQGLVGDADIFIDAYRPGALAARGFGAEALVRMRPGIICVNLSAFARGGDWGERRGYDSLVQAAVGLAEIGPDGQPKRLPCQPLDYITGYLAAFGAMAALIRRAQEGGSWQVELSLDRTALWLMEMADRLGEDADVPAGRSSLEAISDRLMDVESPFGMVRHLKPALELTETPGYWALPPVPLGSDPAKWPR